MAKVYLKAKNHRLSLDYLQRIMDNKSKIKSAFLADVYIHMGRNLSAINQNEQATKMFDTVAELQIKELHDKHPDLSYTYLQVGLMHLQNDNFDKSYEFFQKAYQLQLNSLPGNHSDFAETFQNFGDFYMKQSNTEKAIFYYEKRLENQLKTLSWDHPSVMKTYSDLGHAHWKRRNFDAASKYFEKILRADQQRKKQGETSLSTSYRTLADLYLDKYETTSDKKVLDQSTPFYLNCLKNELETKLPNDYSLLDIYKILAKTYYRQGKLSEAMLYYNRTLDCYFGKLPLDTKCIDEVYESIKKIYLKKKNFTQSLLFYSNLDKSQVENKSQHIKNLHFEKYHLDQSLYHFQEQLKKKRRDSALNYVVTSIHYEKQDYEKVGEYFSSLLMKELNSKSYADISLKYLYGIIGNIYLKKRRFNQALIYFFHFLNCQLQHQTNSIEETLYQIGRIFLTKDYFIYGINTKQFTQLDSYLNSFQLENSLSTHLASYLTNSLQNPKLKKFSPDEVFEILGNFFLRKQYYIQALNYFQSLLNRQAGQYSQLMWTYLVIGDIYAKQGYSNQAIQFYQYSLQIAQGGSSRNRSVLEKIQYRIRTGTLPDL
ncbi:unnamed protein product [Adineta ricciae]|nr:unnamed protein product [Adineta ricciae]